MHYIELSQLGATVCNLYKINCRKLSFAYVQNIPLLNKDNS